MPSPWQFIKGGQCQDAGDVVLVKGAGVGASFFPVDSQDLVGAALVILLQYFEVSAVDSPRLRAISELGTTTALIHDLGVRSDVVVLEHLSPQAAEGRASTLETVLNLLFNSFIGREDTSKFQHFLIGILVLFMKILLCILVSTFPMPPLFLLRLLVAHIAEAYWTMN
eukprot:g42455.t1